VSLTSALTAASAAGFDLKSLALRTQHDPVQVLWTCGEPFRRQPRNANIQEVKEAIRSHLSERGEPASYLHVHAAGLIALATSRALRQNNQEFDEALRGTQALIQTALEEDGRFVHYSSGESVDTGLWGLVLDPSAAPLKNTPDSLSDRVEIAVVTFLQKNPESIFLDIEQDLYPRFPGLLTPSKAMIYSVLSSYAEKESAEWTLRAEDVASARRDELKNIAGLIEAIGRRLNFTTRKQDRMYLWEQNSRIERIFTILASALIGRAISETPYPPEQTVIVIPGGRAALAAYKAQRDPSLAARMKLYKVVKYRLLRTLIDLPVLTRETFEEQVAGDPLEKSKSQLMMF
jgi:hypothetical protein